MAELGFVIEDGILREEGGGCHQATWTELALWDALQQARALALEEARTACDALGQKYRDAFKGRRDLTLGQRFNPHTDGLSDGAWECEEAIRALIGKEPTL